MTHTDDGIRTKKWKMICIRKASPGPSEVELAKAMFHFGRSTHELEGGWIPPWEKRKRKKGPSGTIPEGLVSVLEESDLGDEALETGVEVEITNRAPRDPGGWHRFDYIAQMERGDPGRETQRFCYLMETEGTALEMVRIDHENEMPRIIWIRAVQLSEDVLAWAVGSRFLTLDEGQTTLEEFCDLGCHESGSDRQRAIPLPGPSPERRGCC